MKIQYIAVIFVIIILPISLVMSSYIQNQIDAITLQTAYDKNLINATYDAIIAFQLNTTNNKYSSISDSKIRDIEASVNTFYNSLNNSMAEYAQAAKDLESYIPAMLFTLYDGYYIYTSYDDVYDRMGEGKDEEIKITLDGKKYKNGLKPYVYYSAKYKLKGNIIVVNYTLDNKITVYGDVGDGDGYTTKSGYLINPDDVNIIANNENEKKLTYNGVTIKPEKLTEHLITLDENGIATEGDYNYVFYQNEKIYQNVNGDVDGTNEIEYFWYRNYMKTVVNDPDIKAYLKSTKKYSDHDDTIMSTSAFDYYYEAKEFSNWVNTYLGDIKQKDTIRDEDGINTIGDDTEYLAENTESACIFNTKQNGNDPLVSDSTFNNHRLAVIRKTIETNLNTVISNYHATTLYDYAMPVMSDDDWYRILNNVSLVTFMQGMSIGYRYYSNYAIVTNNVNKEVVKTENIYIITDDGNGNREYHQPGCKDLIEGVDKGTVTIVGAYPTASFQRQSIRVSENSEDDKNFYYQSRGVEASDGIINDKKILTGCYNCIVNATADYDVDDIISGNDLIDFQNKAENGGSGTPSYKLSNSEAYKAVRTFYLTALARERYDLYKVNVEAYSVKVDDDDDKGEEIDPVATITLNNGWLILKEGDAETLIATVTPDNDNIELEWSSNNNNVATVDGNGHVTAIAPGEAKITVKTTDGSLSANCTVIVNKKEVLITNIEVDETLELYENETRTLTIKIEPTNATNKNLQWSSSNDNIVTVDSSGTIRAVSQGDAEITVTSTDGSNKSATCKVKVIKKQIPITSIKIDESLELYVNQVWNLTPNIEPTNATNKNLQWSSSNNNIVTVDSNGTLKAKSIGKAIITVKTIDGSNLYATCEVTVKRRYLADVAKVGDYVQYTANGYSNWRVMSVTGSGDTGVVTLISAGNATTASISYMSTNNYITTLNNICKKYINNDYATFARCVGTTSSGSNNSSYSTEINKLKTDGLAIIGEEYWIGYQYTDNGCFAGETPDQCAYYVKTSGSVTFYRYPYSVSAITKGIRPVITLKAGIYQIDGTGNQYNPYVIQK
mgnify:CR=1 FL=1